DGTGALIFLNTIVAPAAGILGYIVIEYFKDGKPTAVGAASGIVAGLVAITPACANLSPFWAIVLGAVAGAACCFAIDLKYKLVYDDSLDVVGLHLVAGVIGTLYLGFFAIGLDSFTAADGDAAAVAEWSSLGLFVGGGIDQLITQIVPVIAVMAYSFGVAFVIAKALEATIGFRVTEDEE